MRIKRSVEESLSEYQDVLSFQNHFAGALLVLFHIIQHKFYRLAFRLCYASRPFSRPLQALLFHHDAWSFLSLNDLALSCSGFGIVPSRLGLCRPGLDFCHLHRSQH